MPETESTPTVAVISPDGELGTKLRKCLESPALAGRLVAEATADSKELVRAADRLMRSIDPDIVVLDLGTSPQAGVREVCRLTGGAPDRVFVVVGPRLPYEGLVALMRAGVAEHLTRPLDDGELEGAYRRAVAKLGGGQRRSDRRGRVISTLTGKAGAGVTTIATNVAMEIHRRSDGETLLLDFDLESAAAGMHLGLWPRFDFLDVVRNPERLDESLLETGVERHETGLHFLHSSPEIGEGKDPGMGIPPENFRAFLRFLQQHYDNVVVDLGSGWSSRSAVALEDSEEVLVVVIPEIPTLRRTQMLLPWVDRAVSGDSDRIGVVLNRWSGGEDITLADVEKVLEKPVEWQLARDDGRVLHSVNAGKPIVLNGSTPFSKDLTEIVDHVLRDESSEKSRGPLQAILSIFGKNGAAPKKRRGSRSKRGRESSDV